MNYKKYILQRDKKICDKNFPAGSIIIIDENNIYICENLPCNYKGDNPFLTIWTYNECTGFWEKEICRNSITKMIYDAYIKAGKPQRNKYFLSDIQTEGIMKKENIRHKKGSGRRINNSTINNPVRYKQVTQYAYYANLDNCKSGNASVVAASFLF